MEQSEADAIFESREKFIQDDIFWANDIDHSGQFDFRVPVYFEGTQLIMTGSHNPILDKWSFVLLHPKEGRIYALDIGTEHENEDGTKLGEVHKHRWKKEEPSFAYAPTDITAPTSNPRLLWIQFCQEAKIIFNGVFHDPPNTESLFKK